MSTSHIAVLGSRFAALTAVRELRRRAREARVAFERQYLRPCRKAQAA